MKNQGQNITHSFVTIWMVVIVMAGFSFQATLWGGTAGTPEGLVGKGFTVTTESSKGVYTASLNTSIGRINVNFPEGMAAGEPISGSIYVMPSGNTAAEIEQNLAQLNKCAVEIAEFGKQQIPVTQKRNSWNLGQNMENLHVAFKNEAGAVLGSTEIPILAEAPAPASGGYSVPVVGQAQDLIRIDGPFDGNFNNTAVRIGGQEVEPLVECPRGLVVLTPPDVTGMTEVSLKEGDFETEWEYRNVTLSIEAGRTTLLRGEKTNVTVIIRGLEELEEHVPLRIENLSPGVVQMEGAGTIDIRPADVKPGGIFTYTCAVTGIEAGNFRIRAEVEPIIIVINPNQHLKEAGDAHNESEEAVDEAEKNMDGYKPKLPVRDGEGRRATRPLSPADKKKAEDILKPIMDDIEKAIEKLTEERKKVSTAAVVEGTLEAVDTKPNEEKKEPENKKAKPNEEKKEPENKKAKPNEEKKEPETLEAKLKAVKTELKKAKDNLKFISKILGKKSINAGEVVMCRSSLEDALTSVKNAFTKLNEADKLLKK